MEVGIAWNDGGLCGEVGVTTLDTLLQEKKRRRRRKPLKVRHTLIGKN